MLTLFLFLSINPNSSNEREFAEKLNLDSIYFTKKEISNNVEECLVQITRKTVNEIGLLDKEKFDDSLNKKFLQECIDFNNFENQGFIVEYSEPQINTKFELKKHINIDVVFDINIKKEKFSDKINRFNYNMNLLKNINLPLDENSMVVGDVVVPSEDGESILIIPSGTKVTYDGLVVENVQNFIVPTKRSNILGHTMYDIKPDGLEFSKPIKLIVDYSNEVLPDEATEEDLRIVYCTDDKCEAVESYVNTIEKKISASIMHTTAFGIDLTCLDYINDDCPLIVESYEEEIKGGVGPISQK